MQPLPFDNLLVFNITQRSWMNFNEILRVDGRSFKTNTPASRKGHVWKHVHLLALYTVVRNALRRGGILIPAVYALTV